MEELASLLMHSRTQAHTFHLGVTGEGSFAAHNALGTYYDKIVDQLDGLIEAYQGYYGLITLKPVTGLDTNCDIENIIAYFDKLCMAVDKLRKGEKLQLSWIQNEIDNIVVLLNSTKYKLKFLK